MDLLFSLFNVVRKELKQALRDRRMLFMLVAAPVIQLVMFGYAIDLTVDHIPTVVCDQDRTPASRELVDRFLAEGTFVRRGEVLDPSAAEAELDGDRASVALIVPRGFSVRRARADAPEAQVLVDGTDATRAAVAANDARQILLLQGVGASVVPLGAARVPAQPIAPRVLYNPRLKSPVYMVPGILATLLLNVTAIVTAMGLARERETGTIEQILVTPIRPVVLLAGKCVPFILFGLVDVLAVLIVGSVLFDVPLRGPLGVVALGSFLYLFSTLGFGIFIATISASQQQAMLGAFGFMLPAMLLSGFMSPIDSMPSWLQPFTMVIPMRHYIEIMRGCLLKGATMSDLATQLIALAALGVAILSASVMRFRKGLG